MKFPSFFKKDPQLQALPPEENVSGPSQEEQIPQRRQFHWFNSKVNRRRDEQTKKDASHNRTESNETSITHLSLNKSYSAEGQAFVEETDGAYEVLSPDHMGQYGKSLLELDAAGASREITNTLHSGSGSSSIEGLSLIMEEGNSTVEGLTTLMEEENSRDGQSLDGSVGSSSREVFRNPSPKVPPLSNLWDERDNISSPQEADDRKPAPADTQLSRSPTKAISPRMIQMDGSIMSHVGGAWIDSALELCNKNPTQIEDKQIGGSSSISGESSERTGIMKPKTHRRSTRNFRNFLSRPAASSLTPVPNKASDPEVVPTPMTQTANDNDNKGLEQRTQNERWTAPDGTPRFLA